MGQLFLTFYFCILNDPFESFYYLIQFIFRIAIEQCKLDPFSFPQVFAFKTYDQPAFPELRQQ